MKYEFVLLVNNYDKYFTVGVYIFMHIMYTLYIFASLNFS